MFSVVPLGSVAVAVSWIESARPTAHGDGVIEIAETVGEEVELLPHAAEVRTTNTNAEIDLSFIADAFCKFAARGERPRHASKNGTPASLHGRNGTSGQERPAPDSLKQ
jgi:hypothetical protein